MKQFQIALTDATVTIAATVWKDAEEFASIAARQGEVYGVLQLPDHGQRARMFIRGGLGAVRLSGFSRIQLEAAMYQHKKRTPAEIMELCYKAEKTKTA